MAKKRAAATTRTTSTGTSSASAKTTRPGSGAKAKGVRNSGAKNSGAKKAAPRHDRAAKVAAMQAQARSKERTRAAVLWGIAGVLALALIGGLVWFGYDQVNKQKDSLGDVKTYQNLGRNHVETEVNYPQTPPVGGDHHAIWQNCGVYTQPLKNIYAVHSLEHGAVWITYEPSLAADQVKTLTGYAGDPFMLMSPMADQGAPIVLTAWGHQLKLDSVDDTKIRGFIREYKQGPQNPEPGAACSGGTSEVAAP